MFGQQFPNPIASAAKWIFIGFFGVILMGFLLGANLKDATWLNSDLAAAEANRINIENTHQQATYELQERLATAQTEAEIQQVLREQQLLDAQYQHDIQVLAQDLAHREVAFKNWMTVRTLLVGLAAITLSILLTIWAGAKAIVSVRAVSQKEKTMTKSIPPVEKKIYARESYDPLDAKAILYANRLNERLQEIAVENQDPKEEELLTARMKNLGRNANLGTEEYKRRPLAR